MQLPDAVHEIIKYVKHIRTIPKEAGRVAHFAYMVGQIFGHEPKNVDDFTASMERGVTYVTKDGVLIRRGRLDAMLGHVIMEFKVDLKAGRKTAIKELKAYAVGLCREAGLDHIPFMGLATDGVTFERFLLNLPVGKALSEDNVEVTSAEVFEVKPDKESAESFYWFLMRNLMQTDDREATPQSFARDFGPSGQVYSVAMRSLEAAYELVRNDSDIQVAKGQWSKFLQYSYGSKVGEGQQGRILYLKHSYLSGLAKFMVWAAFQPKGSPTEENALVRDIVSGEFLGRMQVTGGHDRDIFHWVLKPEVEDLLAPMWLQLLRELKNYRLKNLKADVLKVLYETLVDPQDRHDLGEYYTPEWLCETVTDELWPEGAEFDGIVPTTLDPTCGSGSFLVTFIQRAKRALEEAEIDPEERANFIADRIVGFDVHPLAVMVARANYLLALGSLMEKSRDHVFIPVFMADTLIDRKDQNAPIRELNWDKGVPIRIGDPELDVVNFPTRRDEERRSFFDVLLNVAKTAAEEFERGNELSLAAVEKLLSRRIYNYKHYFPDDEATSAVRRLGAQMGQLARENRDTIWAFIARNFFRPYMFNGYFKFVVGNPPWLSFRYVSNAKYKEKLERFAITRYGVCSDKSSLRTQTELATTFLLHACHNFLYRNTGQLAFVVPRSVFSGDQHAKFREGPKGYAAQGFRIDKIWDLMDVQPLFNVPSCVVFAKWKKKGQAPDPIPGAVFKGRLGVREPLVADARERLTRRKVKWHLVKMGGRTAWSDSDKAPQFTGPSYYADKFFQGATIVPRNAFFVRVHGGLPKNPDKSVPVETDPEQAKTAKEPWKSLHFKGDIARRFLFKSAVAKHVLPFTLDGELPDVALPLILPKGKTGKPRLLTSKELREEGYVDAARYFENVEEQYAANRKGAASKRTETLSNQLDYMGKLTGQNLRARYLAVYAKSGTNVVSAVIDRNTLKSPYIMDHVLYSYATPTAKEAHFLCAFLNAPSLNTLIKPFQSRGLQGERDVHKKVLEVPLPKFDSSNNDHHQLAELGADCARKAAELRSTLTGKTVGTRRTAMRNALKDELAKIDALLPKIIKGM
jgi:hypothetical protein